MHHITFNAEMTFGRLLQKNTPTKQFHYTTHTTRERREREREREERRERRRTRERERERDLRYSFTVNLFWYVSTRVDVWQTKTKQNNSQILTHTFACLGLVQSRITCKRSESARQRRIALCKNDEKQQQQQSEIIQRFGPVHAE